MERGDDSPIQIVKATLLEEADASLLLDEYYREVGVVQIDTPDAIRNFLRDPDFGFWIAYVEGTPAGCVALRPIPRIRGAGECKRLYVRAPFRRRGLAEALLDAMEAHARKCGRSSIYLDSKDDLQNAIALYLRRGYEPCIRYNENPQATVFLRKSLRDPA
jgi:GNAT superfamily N-acetyltransferase